ncbi:DUF4917 family protein [Bradyrhizobium japonicum]|uniref:DUF4917 family protein n=1 Tax=Bradyrhizobium japonicum TaxID=375 RepID=UPI001BA56447|nr:DUF4917 family protein [Bradyrhizobium japonicum]MBR0911487.1 DUF4917 family protein [Bradyrhizobium japonicum]
MPEVLSFDKALKQIGAEPCSILLGNGFSSRYCAYTTLLEKSGLPIDAPCRRLFDRMDTKNFEQVIRALEDASVIARTYGNDEQADILVRDAELVRKDLITAIQAAHPTHLDKMLDVIPSCVEFLNPFKCVFTTNYDLLLYWVVIKSGGRFGDGFLNAKDADGFRGPFQEDNRCNVYNVHGGLQLFVRTDGELSKRLAGPDGGIEAIGRTIAEQKRFPLYVAEGNTESKQRRIHESRYLTLCFQRLKESSGCFFVYGSAAADNDAHIYDALFRSKIKHLYFCIYDQSELPSIDGRLSNYQKSNSSKIPYTFVDSKSAGVWE